VSFTRLEATARVAASGASEDLIVEHWVIRYARPVDRQQLATCYSYDAHLQLNVLPDGHPVITDRSLLAASGTTTSTAGSATHFDD
jgi:putative ATP-grasp target RiPP